MLTPEGREKAEIRRFLNSVGAYHVVTQMGGFGSSGTADILACIAGYFVAIEVKREGKEPTPRQWTRIHEIEKRGGFATWGTAEKVIREIREWANANAATRHHVLPFAAGTQSQQLPRSPQSQFE